MNIVLHVMRHTCAQYGIILRNDAMVLVLILLIWLESHGTPYMVAHS
jgi:hypothetical protein